MTEELLSHPDKSLIEHLTEVAKIAMNTINRKSFNFSIDFKNEGINISELIPDLVYLSAAFHDLGKATSFFQKYIRNPQAEHDKRKSHALISAVFVYFIINKYLKNKNINKELAQLLSVFTFSAVKRHHGRLINLSDEILIDDEWRELLKELAKNINPEKIQELINWLLSDHVLNIEWNDFVEFIETEEYNGVLNDFSFDILQDSYKKFEQKTKIALYYIHQLIYSALLFADKNEVIVNEENEPIKQTNIVKKIS
ncbi:MAG: CRISPR-associated endonuclease Cas3'', partial [Elusimicrobiota bacterium]